MPNLLRNCPKKSLWLFICTSDDESFMKDIAYFAEQIKFKQNKRDNNFLFFTNNIGLYTLRGILENKGIKPRIFSRDKFKRVIKLTNRISKRIPFLGCVVSSHGNPVLKGIENLEMPPNDLIKILGETPGLKQSLLLLGQCYSGIYTTPANSKICVVGASRFGPSLCFGPTDGTESNIFLEYFAYCIKSPEDIDNDGKYTILDCYKYAACRASENLIKYKSGLYKTLDEEREKIKKLQMELLIPELAEQAKSQAIAELGATTIKFDNDMEIYHTYPEFWISNHKLALNMEIKDFIHNV